MPETEEENAAWKEPGTVSQPNLRYNLSSLLGIRFVEINPERMLGEMEVRPDLMQPWGYLHGGAIVTLADTLCGIGAAHNIDATKEFFLTVELKTNFTRAVRSGLVRGEAKLISKGRQVQLWECRVTDDRDKLVAFVTATQLVQKL